MKIFLHFIFEKKKYLDRSQTFSATWNLKLNKKLPCHYLRPGIYGLPIQSSTLYEVVTSSTSHSNIII